MIHSNKDWWEALRKDGYYPGEVIDILHDWEEDRASLLAAISKMLKLQIKLDILHSVSDLKDEDYVDPVEIAKSLGYKAGFATDVAKEVEAELKSEAHKCSQRRLDQ